ncbi:orotidine-5'-phosphate decarboxylase [Stella humosa]|uniref:Orotidine 5'-phosphate decarboxylase n=1 Tax=Stella humosa TaxID=94 RepID=A0A3N1LNW8_9PROT|nr:orotidine-5'-phosphate decarboxylase [Stella humosa]ROP90915.1 orotidine-5'-phosphate decarboxylase [Stella humosa]BBK34735.1 orotidine 5'-phosphate decarboxylase [Stella humosa]
MPEARRIDPRDRLIVALDLPTVAEAEAMVRRIGPAAGFYKIGLQLLFAGGIDLVRRLVGEGHQVFIDAKFLDIPETVRKAVESVARLDATFLTLHADPRTCRAAIEGRGDSALKLLFVTVLTSVGNADLQREGFSRGLADLVLDRVDMVLAAGGDGVVASGAEAAAIRARAGAGLTIVTPGIRPAGTDAQDQKRVATPAAAIAAGADYLVVGRPVTTASDPAAAAAAIVEEIRAAITG